MYDNLNENNFIMFAMRHYSNPHCTDILEFQDDLKRIRYIRRLINKYQQTGELRDRLIINHLVVIYNVFETRAATKIIMFKLQDQLYYLKPILIFLGYWTTDIGLIEGKKINDDQIPMDSRIIDLLRKDYGW